MTNLRGFFCSARAGRVVRAAPTVAAACTLCTLVGCFGRAPSFEVEPARFHSGGPDATVIVFDVVGTNVNDEQLPLRLVRYTVRSGGEIVFSGERLAQTTLPPQGSATLTIPASIPTDSGPFAGAQAYTVTGSIEYELPGAIAELLFDTRVRRTRARFASE